MTDIFSKEKRSWVMSQIKGKNTKIELKMDDVLKDIGYSYEMHRKMFGNPDFVLKRKRIVIFCDGDFWHGYNYSKRKLPKKFWRDKIERNMERDKRITRKLRREGWSVLRFWEHDIEKRIDVCRNRIIRKIRER